MPESRNQNFKLLLNKKLYLLEISIAIRMIYYSLKSAMWGLSKWCKSKGKS